MSKICRKKKRIMKFLKKIIRDSFSVVNKYSDKLTDFQLCIALLLAMI